MKISKRNSEIVNKMFIVLAINNVKHNPHGYYP